MQLMHIFADVGEVRSEYTVPIKISKIFIIKQRFGGYVAILTEVAHDLGDVFVLEGIQGTVVKELQEPLYGQLSIHT